MVQSSSPKQSRADQDSRSDVDRNFPVDQTRKEDDEASDDSCGSGRGGFNHIPKPLKEVDDVDDPSGKNKKNAQKKRIFIFNGKEEANGRKRLRSSPGQSQTRADQDSRSDVDQDLPVDQTRREDDVSPVSYSQAQCVVSDSERGEDSLKNGWIRGTTFQLQGGDGGGSATTGSSSGGSATTGSSGQL